MSEYHEPVRQLLDLGRMDYSTEWPDYIGLGLTASDVPELIRLMQDCDLSFGDAESTEVYAYIHAWRALGQLRAEAAIEPLLDLLAEQDCDESWNDWTTEEVPVVLGMIGPPALIPILNRLRECREREWSPSYFSLALKQIGRRHPELRDDAVTEIARILESAEDNEPHINGFVIADLIDLKAVEAWPVVEAAFAADLVDESIVGDVAEAKYLFGLGPLPPPRIRNWQWLPQAGALTPKQRADQRKAQKKAKKRMKMLRERSRH